MGDDPTAPAWRHLFWDAKDDLRDSLAVNDGLRTELDELRAENTRLREDVEKVRDWQADYSDKLTNPAREKLRGILTSAPVSAPSAPRAGVADGQLHKAIAVALDVLWHPEIRGGAQHAAIVARDILSEALLAGMRAAEH